VTDRVKRKLSAKQILGDIRLGMDPPGLKRKYGLSDKAFESIYRKLSEAGLLTEYELRQLKPMRRSFDAAHETPGATQWRCPACNAPQPAEMGECPACGVVAAKFVALQEEARLATGAAPPSVLDAAPSHGKGWTKVVVGILVFALIGGAIVVWATYRAKEKPRIAQLDLESESSLETSGEAGHDRENTGELETSSVDSLGDNTAESPGGIVWPSPNVAARPEPLPPIVEPPAPTVDPHAPRVQPPLEPSSGPPTTRKYVTGVLRQFSSSDFKEEVVEASKTHPVLFQFYSDT